MGESCRCSAQVQTSSDRPVGAPWERGRHLPSSAELARHLAERFDYPDDEGQELVRISEYASVMTGSGPLYEYLHEVFDADYAIGPLHRFLAAPPGAAPARRSCRRVPADTDDELRRLARARLPDAGEPFDVVALHGRRRAPRPVRALGAGRRAVVVERPNEYRGVRPDERTVILKMHGAVDRTGARRALGQLRDHGGSLHRLPGAHGSRQPRPGHARCEAAPQPLPLPRLRHARLEPARDPAPHLGRAEAEVQVVGRAAAALRARP